MAPESNLEARPFHAIHSCPSAPAVMLRRLTKKKKASAASQIVVASSSDAAGAAVADHVMDGSAVDAESFLASIMQLGDSCRKRIENVAVFDAGTIDALTPELPRRTVDPVVAKNQIAYVPAAAKSRSGVPSERRKAGPVPVDARRHKLSGKHKFMH